MPGLARIPQFARALLAALALIGAVAAAVPAADAAKIIPIVTPAGHKVWMVRHRARSGRARGLGAHGGVADGRGRR
jgi:hypothetical protein